MNRFGEKKLQLICQAITAHRPQAGRAVAAFDADGTLWNTDLGEAFFTYQIDRRLVPLPNDPWNHYQRMKTTVSHQAAYLWLAQINKGLPLKMVRTWAADSVRQMNVPVFEDVKFIIQHLLSLKVQVYIVTASIAWAVEPGATLVGLAPEQVLGIRTKIIDGLISDEQDGPITYRQGKVDGLLAATGGVKPFFCAGNTEGDLPLLECSQALRLVLAGSPPDNDNYTTEQKMLTHAEQRGWFWHNFQN